MNKSSIFSLALKKTLWDVYDNLGLCIYMNIAWFILSIPVITSPAATAACFHIANNICLNEDANMKEYFAALKNLFLKSTMFFLAYAVFAAMAAIDIYFVMKISGPIHYIGVFLGAIAGWLVAFFSIALLHAMPNLVSCQGSKSIKQIWTEAFVMFFAQPANTFKVLGVVILLVSLAVWTKILIPILMMSAVAVFLTNIRMISVEVLNDREYILPKRKVRNVWKPWE